VGVLQCMSTAHMCMHVDFKFKTCGLVGWCVGTGVGIESVDISIILYNEFLVTGT